MSLLVKKIKELVTQLSEDIDRKINRERQFLSCLINKHAFYIIESWATHYSLDMMITEWEATKR